MIIWSKQLLRTAISCVSTALCLIVVSALGLLLAGCGSKSNTHSNANRTGPVDAVQAPDLPQAFLPSPAEMLRGVSFTEAGLMKDGSDYAAALPNQKVSVVGTAASFSPAFGAAGTSGDLAYAVYSFGVEGYDRDLNVQLTWGSTPPLGNGWVALANFNTNTWKLFSLPLNNRVNFTQLADYTSAAPGFNLFAAVIVSGTTGCTLDRIRVGTPPSVNQPIAILQPDQTAGNAPLQVNFNASASAAAQPASIVNYEFDFGEGAGYQDFGSTSQASHTYNNQGTYTARLRVTDDFSQTGTTQTQITVSGGGGGNYDEVEDNDTPPTAMALSSLPLTGFRGNIGPGGPNDGDAEDYYRFNVSTGDVISLTIDYDPSIFVFTYIQDAAGNSKTDRFSPGSLQYTVTASDQTPFYVYLVCFSAVHTDYVMDLGLGLPTAVLVATPLSIAPGGQTTLDASGSTDVLPGTIVSYEFDPEGDGSFLPPQAGATMPATYPSAGAFAPRVRVTDNHNNKVVASGTVLAGSPFDEVENNDTVATAQVVTMPMTNFKGSIGSAFGYASYDGDSSDYFRFNANPGQTINITLTLDSSTADIDIFLTESGGNVIASSIGPGKAQESFQYSIPVPPDIPPVGPFRIHVQAISGYSDYVINASIS